MSEPIVELIYNEINAVRVMTKLKLSGFDKNSTDSKEKMDARNMRAYDKTYETAVRGLIWLAAEYEGKELRKELQKWATIIHKDGQRQLWSPGNSFERHNEGRALMHFSKSIIEAFKKLPRT